MLAQYISAIDCTTQHYTTLQRDIYKRLEKRLAPVLVNQEQWKRDETYLWHEDRIVVPSNWIPALLKWTHESSGHVGADRTLKPFKK